MYYTITNSKLGQILLAGNDGGLRHLNFMDGEISRYIGNEWIENSIFFEDVISQLSEYFAGKRKRFDIGIKLDGSEFEKLVWNELLKIPYGKTTSYQSIAENIGKPTSCRAVGAANSRNPVAIIVPCHRVIAKDGKLSGYAGGVERKIKLLEIEGYSSSLR